jgi:hypothetical protein
LLQSSPGTWCKRSALRSSVRVGGSGRLELGCLLVDVLVCVLVSFRDDERDRFGREVAAADEPLVSLKVVWMSTGLRGFCLLGVVMGSGC